MHKILQSIWKDPVWSKVISAIILGVSACFIRSYKDIKFSLLEIVLFIILIGIIVYFVFQKNNKPYLESHKELDKQFYYKFITEILPENGTISFIREFNFRGNIPNDRVKKFLEFEYYSDKPDFEFIDDELNSILKNITNSVNNLVEELSQNTFPNNRVSYIANHIPPEWKDEQPERYNEVLQNIHNNADEIRRNYDLLVEKARRKLGN